MRRLTRAQLSGPSVPRLSRAWGAVQERSTELRSAQRQVNFFSVPSHVRSDACARAGSRTIKPRQGTPLCQVVAGERVHTCYGNGVGLSERCVFPKHEAHLSPRSACVSRVLTLFGPRDRSIAPTRLAVAGVDKTLLNTPIRLSTAC
jgi:hypothetical protein